MGKGSNDIQHKHICLHTSYSSSEYLLSKYSTEVLMSLKFSFTEKNCTTSPTRSTKYLLKFHVGTLPMLPRK